MKYLVIVLFLFTCVESMVVYSQNNDEQSIVVSNSEKVANEPTKPAQNADSEKDNPLADEELVHKINQKLAGLSMQFGEITITAKNGNVTIRGPIQSISQKIAIIEAIQSVDGVKSVNAKGLIVPSDKTDNAKH